MTGPEHRSMPAHGLLSDSYELPKPKNWDIFEGIAQQVYGRVYGDSNPHRYGRGGQAQYGIDIHCRLNSDPDHLIGIQCKRYDKPLTYQTMAEDIRKTCDLKYSLEKIVFATTTERDTKTTDDLTRVQRDFDGDEWPEIEVDVWPDFCQHLFAYPDLIHQFYGLPYSATDTEAISNNAHRLAGIANEFERILAGLEHTDAESSVPKVADRAEDPSLHDWIDTLQADLDASRHTQAILDRARALLDNPKYEGCKFARYRCTALLGRGAILAGRLEEAADRYDEAYELMPGRPQAIANKASSHLIRDEIPQAVAVARMSLGIKADIDNSQALIILLQALALEHPTIDPATEVPASLKDTSAAAVGLAGFYRRADPDRYASYIHEAAAAHPDENTLQLQAALQILSDALTEAAGDQPNSATISLERLNNATDRLVQHAESVLAFEEPGLIDLRASGNNAAVGLRLCGRLADAQHLLERVFEHVEPDDDLRELYAAILAEQDDTEAALGWLGESHSACLLRAQILSQSGKNPAALKELLELGESIEPKPLDRMRWQLASRMALLSDDERGLERAIAGLRGHWPDDPLADLLDIRQASGDDATKVDSASIEAVIDRVPVETSLDDLLYMGDICHALARPDLAVRVLGDRINMASGSAIAVHHLRLLSAAYADTEFEHAIQALPDSVRNSGEVRWICGTHAFNRADLPWAERELLALHSDPKYDALSQFQLVHVHARQGNLDAAHAILEGPLETMSWSTPERACEVAKMLAAFGYRERAVAMAYSLYIRNPNQLEAWLTLFGVVMEASTDGDNALDLSCGVVRDGAAITLAFDDPDEPDEFLVIESDPCLEAIDGSARSPTDPVVLPILGAACNDRFNDPVRGPGWIANLQHKYVARAQAIMRRYQARFQREEIVSLRLGPDNPVDELKKPLAERQAGAANLVKIYSEMPYPLDMLASQFGADALDVLLAVIGQRGSFRILRWPSLDSLSQDFEALVQNQQNGCVIDLPTFLFAFDLGRLEAIVSICGTVHLPQSVVDQVRARRYGLVPHAKHGQLSAQMDPDTGQIVTFEKTPDDIQRQIDHIDSALEWINQNAIVLPSKLDEHVPDILRQLKQNIDCPFLDCLINAVSRDLVVISDDGRARRMAAELVDLRASCLPIILEQAYVKGLIDTEARLESLAFYNNRQADFSLIKQRDVLNAYKLDQARGDALPGRFIGQLLPIYGWGSRFNLASRLDLVIRLIRQLWPLPRDCYHFGRLLSPDPRALTGYLLRYLFTGKDGPWELVAYNLFERLGEVDVELASYIEKWMIGHMHATWDPDSDRLRFVGERLDAT